MKIPKTPAFDHLKSEWNEIQSFSSKPLYKKNIAFKLSSELHKFLSWRSPTPSEKTLTEIKKQIDDLYSIRNDDLKSVESIENLITQAKPRSSQIEFTFWRSIFEQPIRDWEKALVKEALFHRWKAYQLELTLPLSEITSFHEKFKKMIWPQGIHLLVQSKDTPSQQDLWSGYWYGISESEKLQNQNRKVLQNYTPRWEWFE
ncbi:MAG: hypothetical protein CL678_06425 [Bdellovibrionaceae bacterium]|nr:hypothetical protein [Pseudobdellovibrionaceae bacterium]|tara:strand:- start:541 stop:1146 length:606 start_codon:yes stop_codon:yes gene_type:complete